MEELDISYEENGIVKLKEENRLVIGKGAWLTVLYTFREWDEQTNDYGPLKASLRRYQKQRGAYRVQSRFNINKAAHALQIAQALEKWFSSEEQAEEGE